MRIEAGTTLIFALAFAKIRSILSLELFFRTESTIGKGDDSNLLEGFMDGTTYTGEKRNKRTVLNIWES